MTIRPAGFKVTFAAIALLPLTLTAGYLALRFSMFVSLRVALAILLILNILLFIRWHRPSGRPSLMARLLRSNRLFPRKLALTREGKFLLFVTFGLGFGAINTGSNLLYLHWGMLLALIVASGILSELVLRHLDCDADLPSSAVAGSEALVPVKITNAKGRLSSFSVEATLVMDYGDVRVTPGLSIQIPPRSTALVHGSLLFARRGLYRVAGVQLGTSYPFSFFHKSRYWPLEAELIVYPAYRRDIDVAYKALVVGEDEAGRVVGRGLEFHSTRPMHPGDEWRDVHWKQTARHGRPMVREYDALMRRSLVVVVDPPADGAWEEDVERSIEEIASLVVRLLEGGYRVGLEAGRHSVPAISGGAPAAGPLLTALALLDPLADFPAPQVGYPGHAVIRVALGSPQEQWRLEGDQG